MAIPVRKLRRVPTPKLTEKTLLRLLRFPYIRKAISSALERTVPVKVDISGERGKYIRFRVVDPKKFHPSLFATISVGSRGTKLVIGTPKSAVKKPRELSAFLRRMGAALKDPFRRKNAIYQLRSAGIIGGSKTQSVLVPKSRVKQVVARYVKTPKFRKLAISNPILATLGFNPSGNGKHLTKSRLVKKLGRRVSANPSTTEINIPFRNGQKVTPGRVRAWISSLPNGPVKKLLVSRFEKNMKQDRRFHLGTEPKSFTYQTVPLGASKNVTDVDFVTSEGKEWAAPYQVPRHSGKYDPKVDGRYIHAHGDSKIDMDIRKTAKRKRLPERFHTADGRFVGVVPSRNVRIGAWYTG